MCKGKYSSLKFSSCVLSGHRKFPLKKPKTNSQKLKGQYDYDKVVKKKFCDMENVAAEGNEFNWLVVVEVLKSHLRARNVSHWKS